MNRHFILFALAFAAAVSGVAKTFDVDISTGRPAASNEAYYHGETIEFRAVRGRTQVTNIEYGCVYYQTNGMGEAWWKTDGLVFHPTNDVGAASYRFFLEGRERGTGNGEWRDWHANGLLRLLDSPGFEPNAIERPVLTLDFANIEVANAPWPTEGDIEDATNAVFGAAKEYTDNAIQAAGNVTPEMVTNIVNDIAPPPGDYANVSNAAMFASNYVEELDVGKADRIKPDRRWMFGTVELVPETTSEHDGLWKYIIPGPADAGYQLVLDGDVWTFSATGRYGEVLGVATNGADSTLLQCGSYTLTREAYPVIYADDLAAATNNIDVTESDPVYSADKDSLASAADLSLVGSQVSAIGSYLNAEDARFVSTNYDSVVRMPEAYVEVRLTDSGTNVWTTIWREMTRWGRFVGDAFDWDAWSGFHNWETNVTAEISSLWDTKADRAWGAYDSETGGYSPEGYTQISSSNVLIAAGMAYQRTVTTDGAVWVLQCNQGTARLGGDTNGFFRVVDGDGNTQFEIIKGDRREMGADASGITVSAGKVMTIPYSVEAAEHPIIRCCNDLTTADWKDEDDPGCLCTVSWSGASGAYVATVTPKTAQSKMFVKATYMAGGETYIRNVAPVNVGGGIFCTDGIHKVRFVYNNGAVTIEVFQ